jgi:hypothetical protein
MNEKEPYYQYAVTGRCHVERKAYLVKGVKT